MGLPTSSECADLENFDENELDGSFRHSFYNSGTDWTSLYEIDDYGVPISFLAEEEVGGNSVSGQNFKGSGLEHTSGLLGRKEAGTHPTSCSGQIMEYAAKIGDRKSAPKLVQSDLSNFLGLKPKMPVEKALSNKRYRQQDVGVLLGIAPSVKTRPPGPGKFLTNFNPVGDSGGNGRDWKSNGGFGVRIGGAQAQRKCPFYKKIPGTPFTVDAFCYGEVEGCSAYFLSHFHSDHYGGLTKRWCHGPIYCTPITARLVVLCLYVDPRWIIPLELGVTHRVQGLEVRMLEANHCPGAALILFRLNNGSQVLHTGDFRACREMQKYPELLSGNITSLYLDTTYCNERYKFPLQTVVIDFVVRETFKKVHDNPKTLVVVGSYSIGKERVYVTLAEKLGVPIFADSHRRRILKALEWPLLPEMLSTDPASTCLHVLPLSNLTSEKLKAYLISYYPKYDELIAFRPTGWTYSEKLGDQLQFLKPQRHGPITIYGVPYSEHSSFTEMRDFVQFLRPEKIIPTVNNGKEEQRERMKSTFRRWLAS